MNIIGNIVCIRAIEYEDLTFLRQLINDPSVEMETIDFHFPISEKEQREWYERYNGQNELRCIIENRKNKAPVGYLSVTNIDYRNQSASVGIKMETLSKNREEGDMDDVFSIMKKFCFEEMNLHRLEAEVLSDNLLSVKNLLKHGFEKEGVMKKKIFKRGKWMDVAFFALLRD